MNWCAERTRRYFMEDLREKTGLHPREFGLLSVLADEEGQTQHALGELADVDPSTMVATIDALEARGLAERRPHPGDRRKRAIYLTAAGREAQAAGQKVARQAAGEVFARLTAAERKELNRLLRKLSGVDD
jgi:DNA-binding MarR family transcriptional regulator